MVLVVVMDTMDRCAELASPNIPNFVLSCFLLVGILVSYLPQHYRIIARRSSEGLSPYFVLLGTVSGTCAISNILTLPASRADIECCKVNGPFSCTAGLLGIAQVGIQWSCFFLIMFLFLIFIPRTENTTLVDDSRPVPQKSEWLRAVIVVSISLLHFLVTFLVSVVMLARFPHHLQTWANMLGIFGALLASIQYLPQLWTTWSLGHVGSLSIVTLCIQAPGSFVFAASLAIRLGRSGWSAWAVYVVGGCLQACLLLMAATFEVRQRKQAQAKAGIHGRIASTDDGHLGGNDRAPEAVRSFDEQTPLLPESDGPRR